jgi:hypothetical protein
MTNRNVGNRKYTKRAKTIRDRKKAQIVGRKRKDNTVIEVPVTKKEQKRFDRLNKILKESNLSSDIVDKKVIKRRHRNTRKGGKYMIVKEEDNKMQID